MIYKYVKVKEEVNAPVISTPDNSSSTPVNFSSSSWLSSPITSVSDFDDSKIGSNYSLSSPSWIYTCGSPRRSPQSSTNVPAVQPRNLFYNNLSNASVDSINDESSLARYLKEYDGFEKSSLVSSSMEQPSNLLSMFWSHPVTRSPSEATPMLRRCAYQLAISTPEQATNTIRSSDEPGSSLHCDAEIWRRLRINTSNLTQWTAKLRMWISQTILERLVTEIKSVNASLIAYGLVDICIGEVGLDRLRKTAQIPQVVQNIPSLPCVVPFLEVSANQEYTVSRIRELARGGCMSEFKWNSGGSLEGKEWGEHLPTDAALVLHLWSTYLDSQLPPLPSMPDGRPFSSLYLIKSPNKPTKVPLAISQVSEYPPHYQLITGEEVHHVPKGRNNLFYTILLFLHHIKTKEHGMLGRMNLGGSGVNMLWVIEN
ncbi:transmembrane protein 209 isoform X3 [Lycorma delicatula]|uniref:transmembrane protein 209 isoform X3 n=1 Tax=Lycorma delicatula TaxID=130591 RepID=UPI003F513375